jgi:hypothetical protein
VTTAVDKWPAYARLLAVAPVGHLPTAPTPRQGDTTDDPYTQLCDDLTGRSIFSRPSSARTWANF